MIQAKYTTLAEQLQGISDPRKRRGQYHEWLYLLLVIASALMAESAAGERWPNGRRPMETIGQLSPP